MFTRPVAVAMIVLILVISGGAFAWHYCTSHTIHPDTLSKLEVGMDWQTAKTIIKTKQEPILQPDGSYFVPVRKSDRWCMVDIALDADFNITSIFHDH